MNKIFILFFLASLMFSCKNNQEQGSHLNFKKPRVSGNQIFFLDSTTASYFSTHPVEFNNLRTDFLAPAQVVATVMTSAEIPGENLILFDNPELTKSYSLLVKHIANVRQMELVLIKQRTTELERLKDMHDHGAATGRDVLRAETALAQAQLTLVNERSSLLQYETMLSLSGFNARTLLNAHTNTAWVISEIAENQIGKLKTDDPCTLSFASFSTERFIGKVKEIGSVVDNNTRMLTLRIEIPNAEHKLKAGMLGNVQFQLEGGKFLSVPLEALVTVQGKHYVFIRRPHQVFLCQTIVLGQRANNYITISEGIKEGDAVVVTGTSQLKGLIFGY